MTERKKVQKPYGMEGLFVLEILLDFAFQRLDVCQNISMRNHDAAGLRGCAGCEDDLQSVVACQGRRRIRGRVSLICKGGDRVQKDAGNGEPPAVEGTRVKHQLGMYLLGHSRGKLDCRSRIDWHNYRSAQQASQEDANPFRGAFAPQQNRIAFFNAVPLEFTRQAVCRLGNPPVAPTLHAIAAPLPHGNLFAMRGVGLDEIEERFQVDSRHLSSQKWRSLAHLRGS